MIDISIYGKNYNNTRKVKIKAIFNISFFIFIFYITINKYLSRINLFLFKSILVTSLKVFII